MEDKMIIPLFNKKLIPKTVLFFITEINKRLREKSFNKNKDESCVVIVSSKDIGYNWDAIKVIQKHYSCDDWECKMTHFYKTENKKYNIYTWSFDKKNKKIKNFSL